MAQPIIHHRTPEFEAVFQEVRELTKQVFKTQQDVLLLCTSGTGAMEAAVSNLLSCGDKALVISGGKFGQRWELICRAYGLTPQVIDVEWGRAVDPQAVAQALEAQPDIRAVFATFSETSTGVLHDVRRLAEIVSAYPDTVLVVDAITALGVIDLPMDEWGVDVVVAGSQKALMLPPGLALIALSEKAWRLSERSDLPKFYLDLRKERKSQAKNQTAYTPAITLMIALREALRLIVAEGLDQVFRRHAILAEATRQAVKALGLELFAADSPSNALTAVKVPEGVDGKALVAQMSKKYGVTVAGGQEHLKGKIFRISHLGYAGVFDVIVAISALEMSLLDLGKTVELGAGVRKAQEILRTL